MSLVDALTNPSRPVFLFGSTPPREDTTLEKAKETCAKFAARSAVLATDGFIVYDIQDERSRETTERPFPFRKTMDPSLYASFFHAVSGKGCVVYKCVAEETKEQFQEWLRKAVHEYGHHTFNLVGAASSSQMAEGALSLQEAGVLLTQSKEENENCQFGCVTIPERHTRKGNEHLNLLRKSSFGSNWFITQGIFSAAPLVKLMADYSDLCREQKIVPKKIVLTFAPCGRPKTMIFIKWLGMDVLTEVEQRIFSAANPVQESLNVSCEILREVLEKTKGFGIPLGINVESLSIFKEEIDAAHELFQRLQFILLTSSGSPWTVRWFFVNDPINQLISRHPSHVSLQMLSNSGHNSQTGSQSNLSGLLVSHPSENNKSDEKRGTAAVAGDQIEI
jgi:hypothetical protein